MRIGLVTGEYPPAQGGVGAFTHRVAVALVELGHQVHVITTEGSFAPQDESEPAIVVHRVVGNWRWGCWRQILRVATIESLEILNVQYQAAAYGMHPAINLVPSRRQDVLVTATFHDLRAPYLFPKAGPLRWWVVHALGSRADGVIVTNQEDHVKLEKTIPTKRLSLIPIGSNILPSVPEEYDRDAERSSWGVGAGDVLLGHFGFLNESKGGEELMRVLALLLDRGIPAHLLMIGGRVGTSDPTNRLYAEQVDALINELGIGERVHWTGYTNPEQVSKGLLATDVCLLPYRDGVSFRRGTLHACLAHGRAIVTTHPSTPIPEVHDEWNMLLAQPRDPEDLARAVARVVSEPELRARMENGATALAASFSWERIARQTAAFFGRLGDQSA
jgi:glycosyltransferase involved in cell wall biosynthesis